MRIKGGGFPSSWPPNMTEWSSGNSVGLAARRSEVRILSRPGKNMNKKSKENNPILAADWEKLFAQREKLFGVKMTAEQKEG